MKVVCSTKLLKEAIAIADRNTGKNQTLPILQAVLFSTEKNTLSIRATNLETAIELSIPCKIEEQGSVVVSAKVVSSFLSNITDDEISIQDKKENVFIKTKSTETTIRGYSAEDFPLFPQIEHTHSLSVPAGSLKEGLQVASIAVSPSDMKPELASVCVKIFKNTIKFAATDSFRLSEQQEIMQNINFQEQISLLIPQSTVIELLRLLDAIQQPESLLGAEDKDVILYFNKHQFVLKNKTIHFISRLTEGNFPDYDQIIPKQTKTEIVVKRHDILSAIKLASVLSGRLHELSLSFSPKKGITLRTSSQDTGDHTSELPATIQGDEITVKFNWRYLVDGIAQSKTEYVYFSLNGEQSPIIIKNKGDNSYIYLAMPMRNI